MTKLLSVDFGDDVYKEFSKKCIEVDETKPDVVRGLVNNWINESEE